MRTTTRQVQLAATWLGWHVGELAALAVPTTLALTVTSWLWLLVLAAAAGWVAHETHVHRRAHQRRAVAAVNSTHEQQNQNITASADETDHQEVRHA